MLNVLKKALIIGLILFITIVIVVLNQLTEALFKRGQPTTDLTITAHRGLSGVAPENTYSSVQMALAFGVDRIEIDVHQSKDGHLVLMHDFDLERTTGHQGEVGETTWKALQQLDAAATNVNWDIREEVPELDSILRLIDGQTELVVELKAGSTIYPGIEAAVVEAVAQYDAHNWVIVHSFSDEALDHLHQIDPQLRLHKLLVMSLPEFHLILDDHLHWGTIADYSYVNEISAHYLFAEDDLIKACDALGKPVNVWNLDDANMAYSLFDMGVDGVITNHPEHYRLPPL